MGRSFGLHRVLASSNMEPHKSSVQSPDKRKRVRVPNPIHDVAAGNSIHDVAAAAGGLSLKPLLPLE